MRHYLFFEYKKLYRRKKNAVVFAVVCLVVCAAVLFVQRMDRLTAGTTVLAYQSNRQSVVNAINGLNQQYKDKQISQSTQKILDSYNREVQIYDEMIAAHQSGDWKEELNQKITLDTQWLTGTRAGEVFGEDARTIEKRIELNQLLYDKNIRPLNTRYEMNGYNFLYLFLKKMFPWIASLTAVLFSADVVAAESDMGTFKFLLLQPVSRAKILLCKTVASMTFSLAVIFGVLGVAFVILGLVNGFGDANYPVSYNINSFHDLFLNPVNLEDQTEYIGVGRFLLLSLPLQVLYICFICALSVLISTVLQQELAALCGSVILVTAINVINDFIDVSTAQVVQFLPFIYNKAGVILAGNYGISALMGVLVLFVFTVACCLLSVVIFRKKDILC